MLRKNYPPRRSELEAGFVRDLERETFLSNRTRLEMETGALSISAEQWLWQISYALMTQMMYELVYRQRVQQRV